MTDPTPKPPITLKPCPFCGQQPTIEPWHGGAPTKVMIACVGLHPDEDIAFCGPAPCVTGETPEEARDYWNRRDWSVFAAVKGYFDGPHADGLVVKLEGPRGCGKTYLAEFLRNVHPSATIVDPSDADEHADRVAGRRRRPLRDDLGPE